MERARLTPEEEQRLIERARTGDGEAFGMIYDAFKNVLFASVIMPMVRDTDAAGDVLQETFVTALRRIDTFEWQDRSIFHWLRMIAVNKSREWQHTQKRATVDDSVLDWTPDNTFRPDDLVVRHDDRMAKRERILKALAEVNERYRSAIEMRLVRNLSRAECAAELGTTLETFDVVFFRACRAFRETYEKLFGGPPELE